MLLKIPVQKSYFIITMRAIAFASVTIFFLTPNFFVQGSYVKLTPPIIQSSEALPVRLKIPKIKVDANIEQVGLTSGGAVDVPKGLTNTAWFNQSARPGEVGSAVMDGHFGWWKNGKPAVFNNLAKLRKGDKLYVENEAGVVSTFIVRELRSYRQNDNAVDVFSSGDGGAHLNLITCEGSWNKVSKTYSNRLVVFADKVTE